MTNPQAKNSFPLRNEFFCALIVFDLRTFLLRREDRRRLNNKNKRGLLFCIVFDLHTFPLQGEDRRHLNNKNKRGLLFCIVFDLHYLCKS